MQEFLNTENQYRTALSVLSSAGATDYMAAVEHELLRNRQLKRRGR